MTLDIVGLAEVAEMFDVSKQLVSYWIDTGKFPKPDARLRSGPVWRTSKVRRYAAETGRAIRGAPDA